MYLSTIIADIISHSGSDEIQNNDDLCSANISIRLQPWNDSVESFLLKGCYSSDCIHSTGIGITYHDQDRASHTTNDDDDDNHASSSSFSIESISKIIQDLLQKTMSQFVSIIQIHFHSNHNLSENPHPHPRCRHADDGNDEQSLLSFIHFIQELFVIQSNLNILTNLSMLIRTCKNIIRWYRVLTSYTKHTSHNKNHNTQIVLVSPIYNLQTVDMIHTYVHLYDWLIQITLLFSERRIETKEDKKKNNNSSSSSTFVFDPREEEVEVTQNDILSTKDPLLRQDMIRRQKRINIDNNNTTAFESQQDDLVTTTSNSKSTTFTTTLIHSNNHHHHPTSSFHPIQVLDLFCNLAKHTATLLFHATFVMDHTDIISNKTLYSLILENNSSTSNSTTTIPMNHDSSLSSTTTTGLYILLKYIPQILSLPLFHSSILYPIMRILNTLLVTIPTDSKMKEILEEKNKVPLFTILIFILQSCFTSHPLLINTSQQQLPTLVCTTDTYPVQSCLIPDHHLDHKKNIVSHLPEYRLELITETLRVLFALENSKIDQRTKDPTVVKLWNYIVVYILLLPRTIQTKECKIASLPLFMDVSYDLVNTLVAYNTIPEFISILHDQLDHVFLRAETATMTTSTIATTSSSSMDVSYNNNNVNVVPIRYSSNVTDLLPILIALITLCSKHSSFHSSVKEAVFPLEDENDFLEELNRHDGHDVILDSQSRKVLRAKNMQPIHAPHNSLRWRLIQLMTSVQTNVKRCTSELLWILCNCNKDEYILRTGFGNAVQFLAVKGFVHVPSVYSNYTG